MKKILLLLVFLLISVSATCQDFYWYPAQYRPQLFISGAVAGRYTTVKASVIEWNSPPPSRIIFLLGKYSPQYTAATPWGVLMIKPETLWCKHLWLNLKYPVRVMEFNLFSGTLHPSLKGTQWCAQFYIEYWKWGHPAPLEAHIWLSYPKLVTIE